MSSNPIYDLEMKGITSSPFGGTSFCHPDGPSAEEGKEEDIVSVDATFYKPPSMMLFYSKTPFKFSGAGGDDGTLYTMPSGIDCLLSTYLLMKTPKLSIVKKYVGEYRMCFSSHLGYSVIEEGRFNCGTVSSRITPYSCVCYVQHNAGKSQLSLMRRSGMHPSLTEWTSKLRPFELTPYQPWWYGDRPWSSFQCHELDPGVCKVLHTYKFNLNIASHIRMQRFVDNNWVDITFEKKVVKGMPVDGKFPVPELHGFSSAITPGERTIRGRDESIYIDSVMSFGGDNQYDYEDTPSITIDTEKMLMKTMYISAINTTSLRQREYFNMTTTNPSDPNACSPILSVDVNYGTTAKKFSLSSGQLEGAARDKDFDSVPYHSGYLAYTNSCEASRPGLNVGVIPSEMKMSMKIMMRKKKKSYKTAKYALMIDCVVTMTCKVVDGVLTVTASK